MDAWKVSVPRSEILGQSLFPLALARMERFMIWDDSPRYPKRFRIGMQFEGEIDGPRLRRAVEVAIRRHAMLLAKPDHAIRPKHWVLGEFASFQFAWGRGNFENAPEGFEKCWKKPDQFAALRIWGCNEVGQANLVLDFHHANCDGLGARVFLRDLMLAYDHLTAQSSRPATVEGLQDASELDGDCEGPDWPRLEPKDLVDRDCFYRPQPDENSRPTTIWEKLLHAYRFHVLGPVAMFGVTGEKRIKTPRSVSVVSYHHRTLSQVVSTQILEACDRRGERFNEVAIALLMQTIADWNVRHGRSKPKHRLRILVPTDLRTLRDKTLPAANRFSFAFVGAHLWETADWTTVHGLTHKHMEIIRSLRLGVDFVDILGLLQSIPFISRIARLTLRIPLPMATAILTNLGDVTRRHRKRYTHQDGCPVVGGLVLKSIVGVPPLRPKTALGVGLSFAAGKLTIGAALDVSCLGRETAMVLDSYIAAWQNWLAKDQTVSESHRSQPSVLQHQQQSER